MSNEKDDISSNYDALADANHKPHPDYPPSPEEIEKVNPHFAHIQEMGRRASALNDRGLYYVLFDDQEYLGQWRADQGGFLFFPENQADDSLECEFEAPGDLCDIIGPMEEIQRLRVLNDAIDGVTKIETAHEKSVNHTEPAGPRTVKVTPSGKKEELIPRRHVIELLNYLANQ